MSVCKFWKDRYDSASGMYKCAACDRELKTKVSKSEKNPDRVFVSCDTKFGGCGLFSFTDEEPKKFAVAKAKQQHGGAVLGGAFAAKPDEISAELATLKSKVATIESQLTTIFADLEMLQGLQAVRVEEDHSDHSNEAARKKAKKSVK